MSKSCPASIEVSVVIPALNRVHLVTRSISSVFSQTAVSTEVILVDDGSDPPLSSLLPGELSGKIQIARNPERRNAAYSRNLGAALASSDILAFLDSDDVWLPDHLTTAIGCIERLGRDCLYITPLRDGSSGREQLIRDPYEFRFNGGGDFRTSGFVCRRSAFEAVGGFDPSLEKYQDWDFALRAGAVLPLILGSKSTFALDTAAVDRMSYRPNLRASELFLKKHASKMQPHQLAYFLGRLVRSCAVNGTGEMQRRAKALSKQYVSRKQLKLKGQIAWFSPSLMRLLARLNQWRSKSTDEAA